MKALIVIDKGSVNILIRIKLFTKLIHQITIERTENKQVRVCNFFLDNEEEVKEVLIMILCNNTASIKELMGEYYNSIWDKHKLGEFCA